MTLDAHPAWPWRSAAARAFLALFPLWSIAAVLILWTPWRQKLIVGSVAALTLASPAQGLLAVAALAPLGTVIEQLTHLPYRLAEAFALGFLGTWLLRASVDQRGPRMPPAMTAAAWLLGLAALASVGVFAWQVYRAPGPPYDFNFFVWARQAYFVTLDPLGFVDAARLIEGFGLAAATLYLFRQRPSLAVQLPLAICAGGALAATASVAVWSGAGPAPLVEHFTRFAYRTAHIGDVNAAASYFGLVLCLAIGMMLRAGRTARLGWGVLALANVVGFWFANSRSATLAVGTMVAATAIWSLTARWTRRRRMVAFAILLAAGIAVTAVRARRLENDGYLWGIGFRSQFNETSFRMIAARPLAGVGIGQYARSSAAFLTPEMSWSYGHENAHDYFLQMAAELGITGGVLFLALLAAGLVAIGRGIAVDAEARLVASAAGIGVFLITCLTGHPFLVFESAFPFWILLGLAVGLGQSARLNAAPAGAAARAPGRVLRVAAGAMAVAIVAGNAINAMRGPLAPHASADGLDGFYPSETGQDGRRFHWTSRFASVFVPDSAMRVSIPLRMPADAVAVSPLGVEFRVAGAALPRVLVGREWTVVEVDTPWRDVTAPFKRIDLRVDRTWQPGVYIAGSGDLRQVGVQVGDWTVVPY